MDTIPDWITIFLDKPFSYYSIVYILSNSRVLLTCCNGYD